MERCSFCRFDRFWVLEVAATACSGYTKPNNGAQSPIVKAHIKVSALRICRGAAATTYFLALPWAATAAMAAAISSALPR